MMVLIGSEWMGRLTLNPFNFLVLPNGGIKIITLMINNDIVINSNRIIGLILGLILGLINSLNSSYRGGRSRGLIEKCCI